MIFFCGDEGKRAPHTKFAKLHRQPWNMHPQTKLYSRQESNLYSFRCHRKMLTVTPLECGGEDGTLTHTHQDQPDLTVLSDSL